MDEPIRVLEAQLASAQQDCDRLQRRLNNYEYGPDPGWVYDQLADANRRAGAIRIKLEQARDAGAATGRVQIPCTCGAIVEVIVVQAREAGGWTCPACGARHTL